MRSSGGWATLPITIDKTGTTARTAGSPSVLDGSGAGKLSKSYQFYGSKCYKVVYSSTNGETIPTKRKALK